MHNKYMREHGKNAQRFEIIWFISIAQIAENICLIVETTDICERKTTEKWLNDKLDQYSGGQISN